MTRLNVSPLWDYFDKLDNKIALCRLCNEEYKYVTTTGNLKKHLFKMHHTAYLEVTAAQERAKLNINKPSNEKEVIYEYVVAESPSSSPTQEISEENQDKTTTTVRFLSTEARSPPPAPKRRRHSQRTEGIGPEKRLIEELTEEKINVTLLQKDLATKEIEEKDLRIQMLREEMAHKKQIYELEKQEMLLKIEILKSNLEKNKSNCPGRDMPDPL